MGSETLAGSVESGNPFRPGAGQMPPYLAGREAELALADKRLRQLAGGTAPAQGILFYGPRGNGKTVLLEHIAARARDLGLRAEDFPPAALRDEGQLIRSLRQRARLTGGRADRSPVGTSRRHRRKGGAERRGVRSVRGLDSGRFRPAGGRRGRGAHRGACGRPQLFRRGPEGQPRRPAVLPDRRRNAGCAAEDPSRRHLRRAGLRPAADRAARGRRHRRSADKTGGGGRTTDPGGCARTVDRGVLELPLLHPASGKRGMGGRLEGRGAVHQPAGGGGRGCLPPDRCRAVLHGALR